MVGKAGAQGAQLFKARSVVVLVEVVVATARQAETA
jgi:hypothetical protein